ncbi:MAG: signal peptidase I, partial [Candidatus Colwellbacteria bacterium RIFCSPLOWO2_02_FULL_45_11]
MRPMKQFLLPLLEVFEILAVVLISIYVIYGFIAQPFLVQGASMEPNFSSGDYLLVDEATYYFREPVRGEVIVFKNPNDADEFYIKRIVGLPGEEVIVSDNEVFVNGELVDEPYLADGIKVDGRYVFQLDQDQYFVMGDNRPQSFDSRNWGPLGEDLIIGVVRLRFWPPA